MPISIRHKGKIGHGNVAVHQAHSARIVLAVETTLSLISFYQHGKFWKSCLFVHTGSAAISWRGAAGVCSHRLFVFLIAVASAIAGALIAMNTDLRFSFANAPIIGIIVFFGAFWFASRSANNPSRAVPTLSIATFVSGLFVAPMLYAIAHGYIRGTSTGTIYDALVLYRFYFWRD